MFRIRFLSWIIAISTSLLSAQTPGRMTAVEYIGKYRVYAIHEMNLHRIPASITLAQGLLEADNGNSELARNANNHFGIKCKSDWTGLTYLKDDDEEMECFRKYSSTYESYADHSYFLSSRDRYRFLFDLEMTDYQGWAKGLKAAGYASDPQYAGKLIKIIEENRLYELDQLYKPGEILVMNGSVIFADTAGYIRPEVVDSVASHSDPDGFRKIYENNGVKFILARQNDTYEKIANDFNIYTYQIPKYNEMPKKGRLREGQVIYIERKRRKSRLDYHVVGINQTLYTISQIYAIRIRALATMNRLQTDAELREGHVLRLNKKVAMP